MCITGKMPELPDWIKTWIEAEVNRPDGEAKLVDMLGNTLGDPSIHALHLVVVVLVILLALGAHAVGGYGVRLEVSTSDYDMLSQSMARRAAQLRVGLGCAPATVLGLCVSAHRRVLVCLCPLFVRF